MSQQKRSLFTMRINDELLQRLRITAVVQRQSIGSLIEELVEKHIKPVKVTHEAR